MTTTTAVKDGAAITAGQMSEREPHKVLRTRIGSTEFLISVRFSETSKETIEDKILRLIESEVRSNGR
jgi:hypothetical protein